jgi:hypothetical protein
MNEKIPSQESLKDKYMKSADSEGFVPVGAFSNIEIGRQTKSVAAFLDGEEGTNEDINFGTDLNYKGVSGNYTDMKIHIDDLETFIERVKEFYN